MSDFLDKFKQGLGKGVEAVSIKAKEMADTSRIKGQIATLEKQKQTALTDLALAVCAMLDGAGLEEEVLRAARAALIGFDQQIAQQQEELARVHSEAQFAMTGSRPAQVHGCGTPIVPGAKFCTGCGKPIGA